MQPITRTEFLHNIGYGAILATLEGSQALVPLVSPGRLPPTTKSTRRYASVDAQAKAVLSWYNLPGIAVGLISDNKLVYAKGFRVQNVTSRKPMTEYTIMCVASLSKMLTATAVYQLIENGQIQLDDPFIKHVPYFKMADERYKQITIRHLMAHTAGLQNTIWNDTVRAFDEQWDSDDAAEKLVRGLNNGQILMQDPGGENAIFYYNGIGYDMLAGLIQQVTGELFEDYQRRHILDPLRMYNSTFLKHEVRVEDLAAPHVRDASGNPVVYQCYPWARQFAPDRGFFTNVVDLSHFVMAQINGGWYHRRIMQHETQAQMWTSQYDYPSGWPGTGYNAGFFITSYAQAGVAPVRMVMALGGMQGVDVHVTIFSEQGVAAIVLVNLRNFKDNQNYSWGICDKLAMQMVHGEI